MADFSFLSDSDEDSAVDQVLAEAMDHCVLDQIAAINCSSFSHSALPSHLESRFHRLKTFPSSNAKSQLAPDSAASFNREKPSYGNASSPSDSSNSRPGYADSPKVRGELGDGKVKSGKFQSGHLSSSKFREKSGDSPNFGEDSSPSDSSISPKVRGELGDGKVKSGKFQSGHSSSSKFRAKSGDSPNFGEECSDGKPKRGKLRSRSFASRSNSSNSSTETVKSGCFWCSPKKNQRKKSGNRNGSGESGLNWRNDNDEILSDLKSFSSKEQKKLLKKSIKEEEKIIKEAEKIVKWAKQSSSRMDFSLSDDELSDADSSAHH